MSESKQSYKATFILDTRGREDSVEDIVQSVVKEIEAVDGENIQVVNHGRKEFEQVADKRYTAGIYAEYTYSAPKDSTDRLLENIHLNKTISHKMIVRA